MEFYHEVGDLVPAITGWHIHVKVLRCVNFLLCNRERVFRMVLEDERGQRIEAVASKHADHYEAFIKEGSWISIMNFRVSSNQNLIKAANHHFKINFLESTVVKKTASVNVNPFNGLTSIPSILHDAIDTLVLVDVIGAIQEVGQLENISPNNDLNGFRVPFKLKDKDNEVVECLAIGKEAVDFNQNYRVFGAQELIVILRFWRVERFFTGRKNVHLTTNGLISQIFPNPNIPEADAIRLTLRRNA